MSDVTNIHGDVPQLPSSTRRRRVSRRALAQLAAWVALGALVSGGIALAGSTRTGTASQAITPAASTTGTTAPAVSGSDPISGHHVSLTQFAGKPVVINIWASWCPGCIQEARALGRFAAAHPGVQVLGVDIEDNTSGARAFYRKWGVRYPSISDPNGTLSAQLAATGVPTTLFLDAHRHVVDRLLGAGTLSDFDAGLRTINQRGRR